MYNRINLAAFFYLALSLTGCQMGISVLIDQEELPQPNSKQNMKINLLSSVRDVRPHGGSYVGKHTFTIFMIPTFDVKAADEPLEISIIRHLQSALERAGYSVTLVNSLNEASGPVLAIQLDKLNNYLFSWLYPLGIVSGGTEICLYLVDKEGKTLWSAKTEATGAMLSLIYMSGFETRVKDDLTETLSQIIEKVSSPDFVNTLQNAQL